MHVNTLLTRMWDSIRDQVYQIYRLTQRTKLEHKHELYHHNHHATWWQEGPGIS